MNQNLIKNEIINCNLCPLSKIRSTSVEPVLEGADVLFVSEFFDESFEPLCDFSWAYTSIFKCVPKQNALAQFLKNADLATSLGFCAEYLKSEISISQPKVVVALGQSVFELFVSPLEYAYSSIVGDFYRCGEFFIMPAHESAHLAKNPSLKEKMRENLDKIKGMI